MNALEIQLIWEELCNRFSLSEHVVESTWSVLANHYQEEGRYYHDFSHISSLLSLSGEFRNNVVNKDVVDLAIFFHDVIYDPKSKTNEEDSAELFKEVLGNYIDSSIVERVVHYIIETKRHDVADCGDTDLQFFMDFDMSILGSSMESYISYCQAIRKEYSFYPDEAYRIGRAAFLRTTINENKQVFSTKEFRERYEATAKSNILWECAQLESGNLI